jgi:hypothetical protein
MAAVLNAALPLILMGGVIATAAIGFVTLSLGHRFLRHVTVAVATIPMAMLSCLVIHGMVAMLLNSAGVSGNGLAARLFSHLVRSSGSDGVELKAILTMGDVLFVAVLFYVAYAGNVLLKQFTVTLHLLKAGRRALKA